MVPKRGLEHILAEGPFVSSNVNRPNQRREVWADRMEVGVQRARIILAGMEKEWLVLSLVEVGPMSSGGAAEVCPGCMSSM